MGSTIRRWLIGIFVLLFVFVIAFAIVMLMLPTGLGIPAAFEISPNEITLSPNQGWQFQAIHEGKAVKGLQWNATGGKIGPEGFYTAPPEPGEYQIVAHHPSQSYSSSAAVYIVENIETTSESFTPTPLGTALTALPTQSMTAPMETALPTEVLSPTRIPTAAEDKKGDLVDYSSLEPISDITYTLSSSDIKLACFDEELGLVQALPTDLDSVDDWDREENLILWITLHGPIPESTDIVQTWLFTLDTDNDPTTGRPPGAGPANPEIGPEVSIGVRRNPTGEFYPYIYVWNAALGESDLVTMDLEARFGETRESVLVRVPVQALTDAVNELSQVEVDLDQTVGRAATLSAIDESTLILDLFPERP